jgi:hypothetical protein
VSCSRVLATSRAPALDVGVDVRSPADLARARVTPLRGAGPGRATRLSPHALEFCVEATASTKARTSAAT